MSRDEEFWQVLWPSYFRAGSSRSLGRRIKKKDGIPGITLDDLEKAVKSLNLPYRLEKDKSYPAFWYKKEGRIVVKKRIPKTELIRLVNEKLQAMKGRN